MFGLMILVCYGSMLTSTKTIAPHMPIIRNFHDVHHLGYQLLLWKDGSAMAKFSSYGPNSVEGKIYQSIIDNPWAQFTSVDEMATLLRLRPHTIAFEYESIARAREDILSIKSFEETETIFLSMAIRKGFPLKKYFDAELTRVRQDGLLDRAERKQFSWGPRNKNGSNEPLQISLGDVTLPFVVLFLGCLMGLFISVIERLTFYYFSRV